MPTRELASQPPLARLAVVFTKAGQDGTVLADEAKAVVDTFGHSADGIARVFQDSGDLARAEALYRRSGGRSGPPKVLADLAVSAAEQGDHERATRLLTDTREMLTATGAGMWSVVRIVSGPTSAGSRSSVVDA